LYPSAIVLIVGDATNGDFAGKISADKVPRCGAIAQLVERFHGMEEARGSNPLSSTSVRLNATNS
jgi:hypothetical protein